MWLTQKKEDKAWVEILYAPLHNNRQVQGIMVCLICRPRALLIAICDWECGTDRMYISVEMAARSRRHTCPLYIWIWGMVDNYLWWSSIHKIYAFGLIKPVGSRSHKCIVLIAIGPKRVYVCFAKNFCCSELWWENEPIEGFVSYINLDEHRNEGLKWHCMWQIY